MLNAEKYRNEILEALDCDCEGFGVTEDNKIIMCLANRYCCICQFCEKHFCNEVAKARWLLSEYKEPIKLSRLEYGILEHLLKYTEYVYMTREKDGALFVYDDKPCKTKYYWSSSDTSDARNFEYFNDLFQFVKWSDEKPTSIKGVLENCEVVEDDQS